jgi:hypothetical protein
MIAALAVLAVEARRLLAVERAAGPVIGARDIGLALVPAHTAADHVRNQDAVAYLVEKGV